MDELANSAGSLCRWHQIVFVPLPAPGRSYNGPISQGLAVQQADYTGGIEGCLPHWAGELFLLRVQQVDHAGGIWTIVPAPGRSCNALRSQELAVARWHGAGTLLFLLRVQQADNAGGIWTTVPAPGRSYNVLHSQELAVAGGGMVSLLDTQVVAVVLYCQPPGGAGALFLLRVQQADHIDGMVCATVPAPRRSCNVLHSQELTVADGGMVSLLDTLAVSRIGLCCFMAI
ncbi:hypothetical protein N7524_004841 [Penicillium chrysogenum]|nr:hypothetical protein N7524_004841 [Penicillium chrysogenum]